jgi:hypothetical protein
MGFFDKFRSKPSPAGQAEPSAAPAVERRYDNVEIVNVVDGSRIKGHEAVKAYYEKEEALLREHGSTLNFVIHRVNLQASSIAELNGPQLASIKVDGDFVTGTDTVAAVKAKLRQLIPEAAPHVPIGAEDQISLSFSNRMLGDDKLFYAAHYMMLPAWVQVFLHPCEPTEVFAVAARLS